MIFCEIKPKLTFESLDRFLKKIQSSKCVCGNCKKPEPKSLGASLKRIKALYQKELIGHLEQSGVIPKKEKIVLEDGCWYEFENGKIGKIFKYSNLDIYYHETDDGARIEYTKNAKNCYCGCPKIIKKVPAPIQLEVDSFWKTRSGSKIFIYYKDNDGDFSGVEVGEDDSCDYHPNGKCYGDIDNDPWDIVAKWEG